MHLNISNTYFTGIFSMITFNCLLCTGYDKPQIRHLYNTLVYVNAYSNPGIKCMRCGYHRRGIGYSLNIALKDKIELYSSSF